MHCAKNSSYRFGTKSSPVCVTSSPRSLRPYVVLRWDIDVDEALHCWFEADFVPNGDVVKWASDYARRGVSIAIATNQEHRRAKFLKERLAALLP